MDAIPIELLNQSALLRKRVKNSSIKGDTYEDVEIRHIRITYYQSAKFTVGLTQEPYNALLRFDYKNSEPKGVIFATQDKLIYHNKEFEITDVQETLAIEPHG